MKSKVFFSFFATLAVHSFCCSFCYCCCCYYFCLNLKTRIKVEENKKKENIAKYLKDKQTNKNVLSTNQWGVTAKIHIKNESLFLFFFFLLLLYFHLFYKFLYLFLQCKRILVKLTTKKAKKYCESSLSWLHFETKIFKIVYY